VNEKSVVLNSFWLIGLLPRRAASAGAAKTRKADFTGEQEALMRTHTNSSGLWAARRAIAGTGTAVS
jgi:hypothetical protein